MRVRFVSLATRFVGTVAVILGSIGTANADGPGKILRYIDLNHIASSGMQTYPGLSLVEFSDSYPRFANSALIDQVTMLGITSTYIDAPYHVDPNGKTIADWPLEKLANLPILVITKPSDRISFEITDFIGKNVRGKAVLLNSGHDKNWNTTAYGVNVPYLSVDSANWLVSHGAVLVGIDSPLIDNFADSQDLPIHHALLDHGVVISEDLANLDAIPAKNAYLTAVPSRVPMTSFPTRVFATVYKD